MSADGAIQIDSRTGKDVQAHLLRSAKRADEKPRDWLLFFFFRIVDDEQIEATKARIETCPEDAGHQEALWLDFAHPTLLHAQRRGEEPGPVNAFRDWLSLIAYADSEPLLKRLRGIADAASPKGAAASDATADDPLLAWVYRSFQDGKLTPHEILDGVTLITRLAQTQVPKRQALLEACRKAGAQIGALPTLTLFEVLRQAGLAVAHAKDENQAPLRGETAVSGDKAGGDATGDDEAEERPLPVNLAFTFSGLRKLQLDPTTLASFPDAFKEGMAARAARLHDTGPSAPINWEGELGLPSIHGYFSSGGGFPQRTLDEDFWKEMRRDVAAFNDPADERGEKLRYWLSLLFRGLGMEIVHVELGQDPYAVVDNAPCTKEPRLEHFGFRDGLSQPFVDLGLATPPDGGGRPLPNRTWTAVAPGEIFLDQRDERRALHKLPISADLRAGSTFLVFRKLEQDVAGFRDFIAARRPNGADGRTLAAQMMGRWPDGTPLVLSPSEPKADAGLTEVKLNDFLYAASGPEGDPDGAKCPLGAHIRRANPRDIGGREGASRHRILRRSISYGGPLLPPDAKAKANDEKRGLLFVAANARIDVQFEVIQSEWMNGGEFLGQAGLGRCPLLGAHDGARSDSFLEAKSVAPVTGLPRFVVTRGGDYFFAPGVPVVKALALGETFAPKPGELPYEGYALADYDTPGLFSPKRLRAVGCEPGQLPHCRFATPDPNAPETMVFVARHKDVVNILRGGGQDFSVQHYREAAYAIAGEDMLIGTETADPSPSSRELLSTMLGDAWGSLMGGARAQGMTLPDLLRASARAPLNAAIDRVADDRRLDLIKDLAVPATYAMIAQVFGVPGPDKPSELLVTVPFGRLDRTDLPEEWLPDTRGVDPALLGPATLQLWSVLILADLIGNLQAQALARAFSHQAGLEMRTHLDNLLTQARARMRAAGDADGRLGQPTTLVEAFVYNTLSNPIAYPPGGEAEKLYDRHAATILLELVGTSMATIPLTFGSVMGALFDFRIDLASLLPRLEGNPPTGPLPPGEPNGLQRLIYEAERLNPNAPIRMRRCVTKATLDGGAEIRAGEWVSCLIQAANLDSQAFPEARRFSLSPYVDPTGPVRDWKNYLLFGDDRSVRKCWGRDRVAMIALEECLKAAGRLKRLRRPAGLEGKPQKVGNVTIGLPARFTQATPVTPTV
jgi:Dyp-type peroxidase family